MKHFLITRFNVVGEHASRNKLPSIHWLRSRLEIFKNVTVPSIINQRAYPDHWLILFDIETPIEFRDEFKSIIVSENIPFCRLCYIPFFSAPVVSTLVREYVCQSDEWLLTTRLDNDDALAPLFLESIKSAALIGRREFINVPQGLIFANGRAYRKRDFSNPFITLSEPVAENKTVWIEQHHKVSGHAPVRQLPLKDGWIQFVHGGNIANQIRGVRVSYESVDRTAIPEYLMRKLTVESAADYFIDNSFGLVYRYFGSARRFINTKLRESLDK